MVAELMMPSLAVFATVIDPELVMVPMLSMPAELLPEFCTLIVPELVRVPGVWMPMKPVFVTVIVPELVRVSKL